MSLRRLLVVVAAALAPLPALAQPVVDHHQHLFSAALAKVISAPPISAADPPTTTGRPRRFLNIRTG